MKFQREMLEHIALAARIDVTGREEHWLKYLEQMTATLVPLTELNLEETAATGRIAPQVNIFREDVVEDKFPAAHNLSNAPQTRDGYFRVPRII